MATGTPATARLEALGIPHRVHTYAHDPRTLAFGAEAVAALGVPPERFFKTLVVDVGGPHLACGVVPVAGSLDLKAFARALGAKRAVLADLRAAERATGYVRGGISPIGQRTALDCLVDETVVLHDTVLVSAGGRGLAVELAPDDLLRAAGARLADIADGD